MVASAGILLWRRGGASSAGSGVEVLIAHMGGPFWARKRERAWSIPKGELEPGEDALVAARREFEEELGIPAPDADYALLGEFRQRSGKTVTVFATEADLDVADAVFGEFEMEWPPRSGRMRGFPEVDEVRWVGIDEARVLLVTGQTPALDRLVADLVS